MNPPLLPQRLIDVQQARCDDLPLSEKLRNDFTVLLVQDLSRLTRGGWEHGGKIEYELLASGIELIVVARPLPQGDHAGIVKSLEYFAAQQYPKGVSYASSRGQMSAIVEGRINYCMRPPYGIDRLYLSADGSPLYIIRFLSDCSQVKLDAQDRSKILQTYAPKAGYRKQDSERVMLIPGAAEKIAVVHQIFRRRLIDGWGGQRIAKELNDAGIPGPFGAHWFVASVQTILRNSIYTGIGYANRKSDAIFNMRSPGRPTPVKLDRQELLVRKRPKMRWRDRSAWVEQPQAQLTDYLPPDLKELVIEFQRPYLSGQAKTTEPRRDRHTQSSFILKGLLRCRQGDLPMTGIIKGRGLRYYRLSRAYPSSDRIVKRLVRAEPMERAVLAAVREVLAQKQDLAEKIESIIRRQQQSVDRDRSELQALRGEQKQIEQQLDFIINSLEKLGREAAQGKALQLEDKLSVIQQRIAIASQIDDDARPDSPKMLKQVMERFEQMLANFDQMPHAAVRSMLAILVTRLEIDLETLELRIDLALPSWAATDEQRYERAMGLATNSSRRSILQTHADSDLFLPLVAFDCEQTQPRCYQCHRRRRAA